MPTAWREAVWRAPGRWGGVLGEREGGLADMSTQNRGDPSQSGGVTGVKWSVVSGRSQREKGETGLKVAGAGAV